jgi:excisionase family DNA binding protein
MLWILPAFFLVQRTEKGNFGMEQTDELLTASDVARLFKISPDTVYSWRYQGKIPYLKINGAVRFKRSDLQQMIETCVRNASLTRATAKIESVPAD